MSHLSRTTADRKALANALHVADGVNAASKSRSASVAAGGALQSQPVSARRSLTPASVSAVPPPAAESLVIWEHTGPPEGIQDPTLTPCGQFTGFIQCMLGVRYACPTTPADGTTTTNIAEEVWAADGDGRIIVRDNSSAAPTHVKPTVIRKYLGVYVTTLCRALQHVWAGYSDGALRAFSIHKREEEFEANRRHGGAVTALLHAMAPGDYGTRVPLLLSASADFRIHAHHAQTMAFAFQFTTPGACIRCMDTDGDFLFSGGDDGLIRCWSLETHHEVHVPGVYPLHAYMEGGVRSLTLHHNALYACGGACASMWDLTSGELLAVFNVPASRALRCTVVSADFALWVSGSDGFVYVFDIVDLTLVRVTDVHAASHVKAVDVVRRAPVVQTTATFPGGFLCMHSETGRLDASYTNVPVALQGQLELLQSAQQDVLRQRMELRRQAATHRKYLALHAQFQNGAEQALQGAEQRAVAHTAQRAVTTATQRDWNLSVFAHVSHALAVASIRDVVHGAFRRWSAAASGTSQQRAQRKLSCVLLQGAQESFQGACVRRAIGAQEKRDRTTALRKIAADLHHRMERLHSLRVLHVWKHYVRRSKVHVKQQDIANVLEKRANVVRLSCQIKRWCMFRSERRTLALQAASQHVAERATDRVRQLMDDARTDRQSTHDHFFTRRGHLAELLQTSTTKSALHRFFQSWFLTTLQRCTEKQRAAVAEVQTRVDLLASDVASIEAQGDVTEDELDRQIAEKEAAVAALEASVRRRELVILQLKDVEQDIKQRLIAGGIPVDAPQPSQDDPADDAAATPTVLPVGATVPTTNVGNDMAVCDGVMKSLLRNGFNCRSHWDLLADAGKLASSRPGATFIKGLEQAKTDLTSAFGSRPSTAAPGPRVTPATSRGHGVAPSGRAVSPRPGLTPRATATRTSAATASSRTPLASTPAATETQPSVKHAWDVNRVLLDKANRIVLKRAAVGLRQALVAWYYLRIKLHPDTDRIKNIDEIVANAPLWLYILERERHLEDSAIERDPKLPWGGSAAGGPSTRLVGTTPSTTRRTSAATSVGHPTGASAGGTPSQSGGPTLLRPTAARATSSSARQPTSATRAPSVSNRLSTARGQPAIVSTSEAPPMARYPMATRIPPPAAAGRTPRASSRAGAGRATENASVARASPERRASTPGRTTTPLRATTPARAASPSTRLVRTPAGTTAVGTPTSARRGAASPISPPPSGAATAPRGTALTPSRTPGQRAASMATRSAAGPQREISPNVVEDIWA